MTSNSYANVGNHLIQKALLSCKFPPFMISNMPAHLSSSLIDFFRYYSRDFSYNTGVASIRAGLLKKESKGWQNDVCQRNSTTLSGVHIYGSHQLSNSKFNDARERNRFCIEVST